MEKHFKKHIEDDQHQLLIEARGGPMGTNRSTGGGGGGGNGRGNNNAKGLLRVKLNNSDGRPATFSRVLAPGAGGITTQDRATSPFPVNMMARPGQNNNNNGSVATSASATPVSTSPDRMVDTPSLRNELLGHENQQQQQQHQQQQANATNYLNHHSHHHHHQQAAAAVAAAASGPYQFVPFPHRPYAYDLLGLGSMGQSMYGHGANKMVEHANKYRDVLGNLFCVFLMLIILLETYFCLYY